MSITYFNCWPGWHRGFCALRWQFQSRLPGMLLIHCWRWGKKRQRNRDGWPDCSCCRVHQNDKDSSPILYVSPMKSFNYVESATEECWSFFSQCFYQLFSLASGISFGYLCSKLYLTLYTPHKRHATPVSLPTYIRTLAFSGVHRVTTDYYIYSIQFLRG